MIFERREAEGEDFSKSYRVSVQIVGSCEVLLSRERTKEMKEFKYLGAVLYKHWEKKEEIRERAVKGRCVIGSL